MTGLQAALEMYRTAARDTWGSWKRSWWAVFFVLAAFAIRLALSAAMAPFGLAGAFVVGMASAALTGWYLALVRIAVVGRRRLTFQDVQSNAGALFGETISVLFLFSIAELVLGMISPLVILVLVPAANFAFNPAPELIYLGRDTGMDLLKAAWRFMQESWPEWLVPNVLAVAVACGALAGLGLGRLSGMDVIAASQLFGPWFGFMSLPGLLLGAGSPAAGSALAVLAAAAAHAFMLFRGHLFQALAKGSRRSRAWQQRTRR